MGRAKSLLVSMGWTEAGRAHNCRSDAKHRIEKGDRRLTVKQDGDDLHYCEACAVRFLDKDIQRIAALRAEVS